MTTPTPTLADRLAAALADRYRIERELGAGGMATVYLAEDLKHGRRVAVKVLKPELAAVLSAERFVAEIRTTASLQHPHILPLFDSGTADGFLFYVMPFIDGETLRDRLNRETQLAIDDAVRIACEVADALDYAHRHGVIHRDIKPENILLHDGRPMVADFGIALALSAAAGGRMTETGLSLGTPHYMSPEQATADKDITARADIYSLASVLYEMLAGEPPHMGNSAQQIIMKIIAESAQPVTRLRKSVPANVTASLVKALEKLPADRFQTARDFAAALTNPAFATIAAPATAVASARSRPRGGILAATAAIAALAGLIGGRALAPRGSGAQSVAITIEPPMLDGLKSRFNTVSVSPDGQTIAFIAMHDTASQLFVRRLGDAVPHAVPGARGAWDFFFSPDSKTVAFSTGDGHLRKVSVDSGQATAITDMPTFFSGGAWTRDGRIILGAQGHDHGLHVVNASGGVSKVLMTAKIDQARPIITPDGKSVLFVEWGPGFTEDDYLAIGSLETGTYTTTKLRISAPIGMIDGYAIVATSDGAVRAVPVDLQAQRITGEPVFIAENRAPYILGLPTVSPLSDNGTLAFLRGTQEGRLTVTDSTVGRALVTAKRNYLDAVWSPDGRRLAATAAETRGDSTFSDVFVLDIATGTLNRLTSRGDATNPAWSSDGKSIVFTTWFQTAPSVWRIAADGSAAAEKLFEIPGGGDQLDHGILSPDGRSIVVVRSRADGMASALLRVPLEGEHTPMPLATRSVFAMTPAISPDGKWIAFAGSDNTPFESHVFVMPINGSGQRMQVAPEAGGVPRWSRDGTRLYFLSANGLRVAFLRPDGSELRVTNVAEAFPLVKGSGSFDIAPDGRRILTVETDGADVRLVVITNWVQQFRARIAEARRGERR